MPINKMQTSKMPTNKMPEYDFKSLDHLKMIISSTDPFQYNILFRRVNAKDLLEKLEKERSSLPCIRITYNQESRLLLLVWTRVLTCNCEGILIKNSTLRWMTSRSSICAFLAVA